VLAGVAALLIIGGLGLATVVYPADGRASPRGRLGHWQALTRDVVFIGSTVDAGPRGVVTVGLEWLSLVDRPGAFDVVLRAVAADGATHEAHWASGPLVPAWTRGELVRTETDIRLPEGFPSGPLTVSLQVAPLSGDRAGAPEPIELGRVVLRGVPDRPTEAGAPRAPGIAERLDLVDYALTAAGGSGRPTAAPGETVAATVEWLAHGLASAEISAALTLRETGGRGGRSVAAEPAMLGDWFNPPPYWQAGDRFRQELRLTIPPDLLDGEYAIGVRITSRQRSWMPRPEASRGRDRPPDEIVLGTVTVQRSR
jgi:hypothetical protein